jgi:hypothetical protein
MDTQKQLERFIRKANTIHHNKYDYSLSNYTDSHTNIIIICPIHGNFTQIPTVHLRPCGCPLCGSINRNITKIEKYGDKNYNNTTKRKQTNLEKYGVDNPRKSKIVQHKIKQTNLEKYGVENPLQSADIKEKIKQTMLERYNVERFTNRELSKRTMMERHGVEYAHQSKTFHARFTNTMVEKYGVPYGKQLHLVKILPLIEDYNWLFNQYVTLNKTASQIALELGNLDAHIVCNYLRSHDITITSRVGYSYKCISWLDNISNITGLYIKHMLNGGEYKIPGTRYTVDGYCEETNTIYEFHGDYWHGNPEVYAPDFTNTMLKTSMGELYQKTIKREEIIKSLGYNLVVIWENNYI